MIKKISTISLILLFFVATIGLPLTVDLCSLMDTIQVGMCEMHSNHSACETDTHILSNTELMRQDCCKTEIVDKAISDKYLQVDVHEHNQNQNIIALINTDLNESSNSLTNSVHYFNDTSPPALSSNHIYLSNSILLI